MIEMNIPFFPADILIPKKTNMTKWSVIACDQHTSEPDYWNRVKLFVGDAPSTLHLMLPEIYLDAKDRDERIDRIHKTMNDYLKNGIFHTYQNSFIYTERTFSDGKTRRGLVGAVDLEEYDFSPNSKSLIRATEGTISSRIPPRMCLRRGAVLESPHILMLIDDKEKTVIESIRKGSFKKVYDFELMADGGHIKGYLIQDTRPIIERLTRLSEQVDPKNPLFFAVGDGNHSLATAKEHWEELKKTKRPEELLNHPARYALVELMNLHDDSLVFESIQRVVFGADAEDIIKKIKEFYDVSESPEGQKITVVSRNIEKDLYIKNPRSNLPIGSLQVFLDQYTEDTGCRMDYIHGKSVVRRLSKSGENTGFLLPPMDKSELFPTIIQDGVLPRKTFSMGEACTKRFYLEMRKIAK